MSPIANCSPYLTSLNLFVNYYLIPVFSVSRTFVHRVSIPIVLHFISWKYESVFKLNVLGLFVVLI